jgi:hypothetical protein
METNNSEQFFWQSASVLIVGDESLRQVDYR